MAEPVRNTVERSLREAKGEPEPDDGKDPVGLVENADGVQFQCGTCEYFEDGTCHNEDPRLNGEKVEQRWCCNKYENDGMRVIIE